MLNWHCSGIKNVISVFTWGRSCPLTRFSLCWQNCQHNTMGELCDQCAAGFFGDASAGTPEDCQPCACPHTDPENQLVWKIKHCYIIVCMAVWENPENHRNSWTGRKAVEFWNLLPSNSEKGGIGALWIFWPPASDYKVNCLGLYPFVYNLGQNMTFTLWGTFTFSAQDL